MFQMNQQSERGGYHQSNAASDAGLRAYMLGVYNYMAGGVFLTGAVAYATFAAAIVQSSDIGRIGLSEFGHVLYESPVKWAVMLAPLAIVFFLSSQANTLSVGAAQGGFWLFSAAMGMSLSSIFLVYTGASIAQMLFVTSAAFGALSLYGYTTRTSLSSLGTFLLMGLFGLVMAALLNIWLQSSALKFAVSAIGVLVFAGLTAYDTQRIKDGYFEVSGDIAATSKAAVLGALSLYLDFINMFTMLLSLFGERK